MGCSPCAELYTISLKNGIMDPGNLYSICNCLLGISVNHSLWKRDCDNTTFTSSHLITASNCIKSPINKAVQGFFENDGTVEYSGVAPASSMSTWTMSISLNTVDPANATVVNMISNVFAVNITCCLIQFLVCKSIGESPMKSSKSAISFESSIRMSSP